MPWIESHETVGTHPKTRKLARLLNVSVPAAVGHLHLLWHWCLQFAPYGELAHIEVDELAGAAMYDGPPARFVEALVAAGFIDSCDEGMFVHDWHDYAGKLIERRTADAARHTSEYKHWRRAVLERDDGRCQDCGAKDAQLHAHHLRPFATHQLHRTAVDNGITLCEACHQLRHTGGRP